MSTESFPFTPAKIQHRKDILLFRCTSLRRGQRRLAPEGVPGRPLELGYTGGACAAYPSYGRVSLLVTVGIEFKGMSTTAGNATWRMEAHTRAHSTPYRLL